MALLCRTLFVTMEWSNWTNRLHETRKALCTLLADAIRQGFNVWVRNSFTESPCPTRLWPNQFESWISTNTGNSTFLSISKSSSIWLLVVHLKQLCGSTTQKQCREDCPPQIECNFFKERMCKRFVRTELIGLFLCSCSLLCPLSTITVYHFWFHWHIYRSLQSSAELDDPLGTDINSLKRDSTKTGLNDKSSTDSHVEISNQWSVISLGIYSTGSR